MVTVNHELPSLPDDDDLIPSSVVKRENGGVSDMAIWRWTRDPRVQFPAPDFVINGRRYWKRRTLRAHRHRLESQKPHPVKSAASFVQSPRRQTRSTHLARIPRKEERHARDVK
jgi:hypothetical protein